MAESTISVVIPVLNEGELPELLAHLRLFSFKEIIFVDGGSENKGWQWLKQQSESEDLIAIQSEVGRAKQMNAGAGLATSDILLFLHADTRLPQFALDEIKQLGNNVCWGRFDVKFKERDIGMSLIAFFMNLRSRFSGVATGDQAIFVMRDDFDAINGFDDLPIMEDIALSKTLKKRTKPYCSSLKVETSARRWLKNGRLKTIFKMWSLRWRYFIGVSPQVLAKEYNHAR